MKRAEAEATTKKVVVERASAQATLERATEKGDKKGTAAEKVDVQRAKAKATARKVVVERAAAAGTQDEVKITTAADPVQQVEAQLEYPGVLVDVEEVNRLLVRPLPGKTSVTTPPTEKVIFVRAAEKAAVERTAAEKVGGERVKAEHITNPFQLERPN